MSGKTKGEFMHCKPITFIVLLLSLLGSLHSVYANSAKIPLQMSEVLQQLQNQGYTVLQKINYKKGIYSGNAISAKGARVKVFFNPQTETVKATQINQSHSLGLLDVAKTVEGAGYHDISSIEAQKNGRQFTVKALSMTNKPAILTVNGKTGEISRRS